MFHPHYEITPELLNHLGRIEVLKEKIATCPIHPAEEYRLKRAALLSMVHHSTAIEGNTLNLREISQILEGKKIQAPLREIHEVKNYKKALDFIGKRKSSTITLKDILKIHRLTTAHVLPDEKSGRFRKESVFVVRRTLMAQEVLYTAPPHQKVHVLINSLLNWVNQKRQEKLSPVLIAGIAHAEMAAIHPFADGNGRSARLLATLILYNEHYDFRKLFALENYYNTDRPSYYKAIHLGKTYAERSKKSLNDWLSYFVRGFLSEMETVAETIRPFMHLKKAGHPHVVLSRDEIKIMDFLNEMQSLRSEDIEAVLTVSKRTAQRHLLRLIKKGLIKKFGSRKGAYYGKKKGI